MRRRPPADPTQRGSYAFSGALEVLNPQMASWGFFEYMRQQAQALKHQQERGRLDRMLLFLCLEIGAARDLP
jgi:hypothetical protein